MSHGQSQRGPYPETSGLADRTARSEAGGLGSDRLSAVVTAEGRGGFRRVRDVQAMTDSPPDVAGHDLGPGSPDLQLGILGDCLNDSFLIQAADS